MSATSSGRSGHRRASTAAAVRWRALPDDGQRPETRALAHRAAPDAGPSMWTDAGQPTGEW